MMTDEEFFTEIAKLPIDAGGYWIEMSGLDRLIALARIGAAVKPRPIEEAQGGDALVWGGDWQHAHYEKFAEPPFWNMDYFDFAPADTKRKNLEVKPTHFIPLSALPPPEPKHKTRRMIPRALPNGIFRGI